MFRYKFLILFAFVFSGAVVGSGLCVMNNPENDVSKTDFHKDSQIVYHVVMYGQSLMLGAKSVPVISTKPAYQTLMFSGGIRSGYDIGSGNFYESLVPLVEKEVRSRGSGGKLGETPASGFSEEFVKLLKNRWPQYLLLSSPAEGSTGIASLTEPGIFWERFKTDIIEANRLVKASGKVYNVPVILWNQGEKDIDRKTFADTYKNSMKLFQQKADEFIKSVTGQKNTVKILMYQTVSHNVRKAEGNPEIANAQYELAKTEANITMSNTTYQLPYADDNVHLSNIGSKWNGASHAVAAKSLLIDQADWRPVHVKGISSSKNVIALDFHVPVPPLTFDEQAVSNPGNYGFRVFNKSGKEIKIKNVSLRKGTSVQITIESNVNKGDYVWYGNNGSGTGAQNGARGNLRDAQGNNCTIEISGKTIRLDNWCPIFREEIN